LLGKIGLDFLVQLYYYYIIVKIENLAKIKQKTQKRGGLKMISFLIVCVVWVVYGFVLKKLFELEEEGKLKPFNNFIENKPLIKLVAHLAGGFAVGFFALGVIAIGLAIFMILPEAFRFPIDSKQFLFLVGLP